MKWLLLILVAGAVVLWLLARNGPNLAAEYLRQRDAELASDKSRTQPMVTEESISHLPAPVQRYMQLTGSIGKPRVADILLKFDAEMFQRPGQAGMFGPVEQYERFDPPKRLFMMQTRMYGLPVTVLHDYENVDATMRVRLASLYNVVDLSGKEKGSELSRTETVTVLNDLCFYAPSWLGDKRLTWRPIDDRSVAVSFTNGPHTVGATLYFNDANELVNFVSEDRGALQDDGSLRILRWSTPLRDYQDFGGRRFATQGEAVWHHPDGDFNWDVNCKDEADSLL
jgi:hypothetical protein